jgi:hypothetical protein
MLFAPTEHATRPHVEPPDHQRAAKEECAACWLLQGLALLEWSAGDYRKGEQRTSHIDNPWRHPLVHTDNSSNEHPGPSVGFFFDI